MRRSLSWQITFGFIILIILAMGSLSVYLSIFIEGKFLDEIKSSQLYETHLVSTLTAPLFQSQLAYNTLDEKAKEIAARINIRVTFILPTGEVVGDSAADYRLMENHLDRPEVKSALAGQDATETRKSSTLNTVFLYTASPVIVQGQVAGVVRLAASLEKVQENIKIIQGSITGAAILVTIMIIVLAVLITDQRIQPLRHLTQEAIRISQGAPPEFSRTERIDEVGQLQQAFSQMASQLNARINELSSERAKLAALLSHMNDGIMIVDAEGIVQLTNPAAQRIFNVSESEAMGHSLIEVGRQHQLVELWQKCVQTGEQHTMAFETSPERLYIQCIATSSERVLPGSTLLIFQDSTRQRRLEMIRRDFVSNVSHELRTPLASLKAIAETLLEGALDDLPAARRFLLMMENEIDNLTQLVGELLELSRIESGRVPLSRKKISPCDLARPAVERMQVQAERVGLSLQLECSETLPLVNADAERIEQVLVNLIHNSIKFTLPGGQIIVSIYQEETAVIFKVMDSGIGISTEDLPRIFERFYKADRSRSSGGTGLGLSIARHLVEAHGGHIWAESTVGIGSSFYFSLSIER